MASKRVGSIHVEMSLNSAKVVTGAEESRRAVREATREMKANVQEAKATIGLLGEEIGVRLPRHVRGFLAEIPGVATVLSSAFSATAVIALGMAVVEGGKKIVEFAKKNREQMAEAQKATSEFLVEHRKINLELDVTLDKLDANIAKIEKKPLQNGLKLAIDEATLSAANLGTTLDGDIGKILDMLDKSNQGTISRLLGTSESNDTAIQGLDKYKEKLGEVNREYDARVAKSKSSAEVAVTERERVEALAKASNDYWNALHAEVELRKQLSIINRTQGGSKAAELRTKAVAASDVKVDPNTTFANQDKLVDSLQRIMGPVGTEAKRLTAEAHRVQLQAQFEADEAAEKAKQDAKKAADEATAAQRKNAAEQMQGFEAQLTAKKNAHALAIGEEYDFWSQMAKAAKGPLATAMVQEKLGNANQQMLRDVKEVNAKANEEVSKNASANAAAFATMTLMMDQWEKADAEHADSANELNVILQRNRDGIREVQIEYGVATGAITKNSAAQELAAIKTRAVNDEIARLKAQLAEVNGADYLRTPDQAKKAEDLKQQIAQLQGSRDKQTEIDQWAEAQTTAFGGINEEMGAMVARARDTSAQMREIFTTTLAGINESILNTITGKGGDWKKLGQSLATQVAKQSLQVGEGKLLQGLGLPGKADGSSEASALWVRMHGGSSKDLAGNIAGATGDTVAELGTKYPTLFGGKEGGFASVAFSMLGALIPHASGGPVSKGMGYLVGEHGPEPFFPGVSGTMATNEAMRAAGSGGGGGIHFHPGAIDARGATDPAMVAYMVRQGIRESAPALIKASNMSAASQRVRTPGTLQR